MFVFEFEEALFAFVYASPPFEFALLFARPTTRQDDTFRLSFSAQGGRAAASQQPIEPIKHIVPIVYSFSSSSKMIVVPTGGLKARRAPLLVYESEEAKFAFAYTSPPYEAA